MPSAAIASTPNVREATPAEVKAWIDQGSAVLIDVREPDEAAVERIECARLMPLSRFDATSLPSGRVVFHCASGRRSLEAAARAGAKAEVYSLTGGIKGWKAAGLPTERGVKLPISIMRQVQVTVGAVVLVSSVLAVMVSPWFALVAAFMGAGLLFAGATGTCALATVLGYMPWNAAFRAGCKK